MNKTRISAYMIRPDSGLYHTNISNNLKNLQELVKGDIEPVRCSNGVVLIVNDNGIPLNLPYNCTIGGNHLFGNVLMVGVDGEDFSDVPVSFEEAKQMIWRANL